MIYFIIYFVVIIMLLFLIGHIIYDDKMTKDLLFFVISNFILSFAFLFYLFTFKDYLFSLVSVFLLVINTICLCYEIKLSKDKYKLLSIPYLSYVVFIFYLTIDLYLMHL